MHRGTVALSFAIAALDAAASVSAAPAATERLEIRGRAQQLHLYGAAGAPAVVVTSGDGGWVHLGPAVAQYLATQGYFVVGFDAKAYLSSFTSGSAALGTNDVPKDYAALLEYAARRSPGRPLLLGVSVGAGLSVLAATDPELQPRLAGIIALGLPEKNELGWRLRDAVIYMTKKVPNEPLFSASQIVGRVAPVPLALLRSTHDEFVTTTESDAILAQTQQPRRLWTIEAADHRFSDKQPELQRRLKEAIAWIAQQGKGSR
jgi:dienelactone hydrolase